jgi:outer membrane protein TolC
MLSRFCAPGRARSRHAGAKRLLLLLLSLLLLLLLLAAFCGAASAAEPPLTLAEAQRLAVSRSLQLQGQQRAVSAARDMAVAAGQLPDPVLNAGIDNLAVNGADRYSTGADFMTMRRIGLSQELTSSGKRKLRATRFDDEARKTLAKRDLAQAAIERDTALAWLDRYYAHAAVVLATQLVTQSQQEIDAADSAYRGGRGAQAEALAARANLLLAQDRAADLTRRERVAGIQLARWTGLAADTPLAEKPDIAALPLDPTRLATDLVHHPDIAVMEAQADIARTDASLAQAARSADWTVSLTFQQRGAAYANMVSVGLSVPFQWDRKQRQDRELAAKLALADQANDDRDEALRSHVAEVAAMAEEWQANRQRQERYQHELLPLSANRALAVLAAYRGGKASLAEVLAARRSDTETRLLALQLESDTARLWAQLNFLQPEHLRAAKGAP